ncbi:MAG: terminase [Clostridium thermopalmarium]|uniref:phage tail tube protein n=1 Tax=Clostridium thermopalmarium TaxID=29373 RepID=UPI002355D1AA|nr:phage tail tube protein [Clostridium thermopalmarium]MBE6043541.1 terminase [Clostridium thermopalmarium]
MAIDVNRVLSGTSGNVWINGKLLANLKSIELKVTGNFEEINFCGDAATYNRYTGFTGEGTIVLQKIDSTVLDLVGDAYLSGVMPDIKIITKLTDKSTGKSERVAISDVLITEFMLANFEGKSLVEEELPLKFSTFEVLEKIS